MTTTIMTLNLRQKFSHFCVNGLSMVKTSSETAAFEG